ncbi:aquaporin Z [Hymenobacter gelipurpurascens]|uniref:Aquaporin Z n=1 Tax=Hymenobacter gelipurpurascens TaxID=89968 RepID=A0A212T5Y7_9BACT|nr:aquaporin [Hymenobacter gelipurpurascens]SNC61425.1 aquaporin Z [Hymenobacter gelipurpurascens]
MPKYLAEVLGTFAIIFCGTGAIIINQETGGTVTHVGIAITFGLVVTSMIYALGNISGAHFNPAVSIAFAVARKFPAREVLPYIISQVVGAVLASATLRFLFPANVLLGATMPKGSEMQSFVLEFILTYFQMLVVMNVAHGSKEQGMFAGLAIGGVVLLEAMFAGPICGASMNPVRSLAPALVSGHLEHVWLYVVAPTAGAIGAVFTWRYLKGSAPAEVA